jgi:hypothetical protein
MMVMIGGEGTWRRHRCCRSERLRRGRGTAGVDVESEGEMGMGVDVVKRW